MIKELINLLPPVAIYNIIKRSKEMENRKVIGAFIGSAPTIAEGDEQHTGWKQTSDEPITYERVIREQKAGTL